MPMEIEVTGKTCWRRDRLPTPVFLGFPCGSAVKNLPEMWETWVWSLGWEGPLEKGKVTHSSVLAWRIHGLVVQVVTKSQTRLNEFHTHTPPLSPGIRISNLPDSKDACKRGSHRQRLGKGSSPFLILHRLVCSSDTVHALIVDTVAGCYRRRELLWEVPEVMPQLGIQYPIKPFSQVSCQSDSTLGNEHLLS